TYLFAGEYFTEEVRRELIGRYGEKGLYEGGLSVRTTLDPALQLIARKALQRGLMDFDMLRGYRGPVKTIDIAGDWGKALGEVESLQDVPEWNLAVVLESSAEGLSIGIQPSGEASGDIAAERKRGFVALADMKWAMRYDREGKKLKAKSPADVLQPGDVIFIQTKGGEGEAYRLRQVP